MSEFIHLHCHSEYSMLDSAIRLPALCERAVSFGMEACAVTDHGNLCAAAEFQKVCREYGIRPIFGCEIYTCPDRRLRDGGAPHHLILLARTQEGWSNLSHLVSEAWISGFCGKPRADWELLSRFRDGLTCLSACLQGAVPGAILRGDMDGARERALRLASLFPGHFYLELQRTGLPRQEYVNQRLMELGESLRLPLAAANDCHYLVPGDAEARDVLLCVQAGKKLSGPGHPHSGTKSLFFKSPAEMAEAFADCPEAIANTVRIAEDCRAEIPSGKHFFPAYPVPPGTTTEQEFRRIAEEGLENVSAKSLQARHPTKPRTGNGCGTRWMSSRAWAFPPTFLWCTNSLPGPGTTASPLVRGAAPRAAPSRPGPCASRISTRLNTASLLNAS